MITHCKYLDSQEERSYVRTQVSPEVNAGFLKGGTHSSALVETEIRLELKINREV